MIANWSKLKKKTLAAVQQVQRETLRPLMADATAIYQECREEAAPLLKEIGGYLQEVRQETIQPMMAEAAALYREGREEAAPIERPL